MIGTYPNGLVCEHADPYALSERPRADLMTVPRFVGDRRTALRWWFELLGGAEAFEELRRE